MTKQTEAFEAQENIDKTNGQKNAEAKALKRPKLRHRKNERVQLICPEGSSRTQQQFKDDAIIRNVIKRYDTNDLFKMAESARELTGGDYTEIDEFDIARQKVADAEAWFHKLPSHIRRHFGDDPGKAIEYISNPANKEGLIAMGLADPDPTPTPQPDTDNGDNGSQKPVDTPKAKKGDTPPQNTPEA